MMVPKKSLILAGAALALVSASVSAQSQSGKVFMRYNKPLKNVSLDLSTGTVSHGPAVNNKTATTVVDFNNNDLGGFVGVDTGNSFCEWFDAGTKGLGNTSDLMNDIVFAYCSASLTPGSGGPGGSVKLGFYEGYTLGGGAPTTAVAVFTLTGLPGNSASSSFFGGFSCFFIRVFFANLVAFADGPIGYSWKFLDVGASGFGLAGTWPFLSCVSSCSGTISGPADGAGMTDRIDEYCPVGTLRSSFTFGTFHTTTAGTVISSFTSISMDVREAADLQASAVNYNATTSPNGDTLICSSNDRNGNAVAANPNIGGAVVGGTWKCTLSRSPVTGAGACTVKVRRNRIAGNGVGVPPPAQGRLLISGGLLANVLFPHNGTTGTSAVQSIPQQLGFICIHWAAQSITTGGGVKLSSATEGTTGSI
jgi:hypothetical protein